MAGLRAIPTLKLGSSTETAQSPSDWPDRTLADGNNPLRDFGSELTADLMPPVRGKFGPV